MEVDEKDGPASGWKWADDAKVIPGGKSDALPVVSARAGVPAAGRGTQLDPDKSMRGLDAATTPLAHPTGIDAIDGFTSPVGIASLAAGGAGVVRAGVTGGAGAAVKTALAEASPVMKFEVTRRTLTGLGIPDGLATGAAMLVSGYKGKGAAAAEAEAAPVGAHLDRSVPVQPSKLTPQQLKERVLFGTGEAPSANRGGNGRPMKVAAEAATEAVPVAEAEATASAKPTMAAAAETKEYLKQRAAGKTDAQARSIIEASRALNEALGLSTPTIADTKFPKGMRGGAAQSATKAVGPWRPDEGGELFHGTTNERLGNFGKQSEVYLTPNADEAAGYASGKHAPGETRGTPIVARTIAKPGKTIDITAEISDAMMNDDFDHLWLDNRIAKARTSGARYVTYDHPSFSGDGEQHVVVALHPAADVRVVSGGEKP